jgi:hypothetical protein
MNDVASFLMHLFFTVACLLIFLLASVLLKPFQLHYKRKYSTVSLKISYLIYLALFLVFTYLFFLQGGKSSLNLEESDNPKSNIVFALLLLSFFIPNIAILIRRRIKERSVYNVVFTAINVIVSLFLFYLIRATLIIE